jgi:ribosomal protein S18 acetylase RimI-like enzyme
MEDFIQTRFGYCFYEILQKKALIYNLYVHPEYRLQGNAKKLLRHVINEIRSANYRGKIEIEASPRESTVSLKKLRIFYERIGLKVLQ